MGSAHPFADGRMWSIFRMAAFILKHACHGKARREVLPARACVSCFSWSSLWKGGAVNLPGPWIAGMAASGESVHGPSGKSNTDRLRPGWPAVLAASRRDPRHLESWSYQRQGSCKERRFGPRSDTCSRLVILQLPGCRVEFAPGPWKAGIADGRVHVRNGGSDHVPLHVPGRWFQLPGSRLASAWVCDGLGGAN